MIRRPGGAMAGSSQVTRSELLPIMQMWGSLATKGFLLPVVFVIAAFELLFFAYGMIMTASLVIAKIPIITAVAAAHKEINTVNGMIEYFKTSRPLVLAWYDIVVNGAQSSDFAMVLKWVATQAGGHYTDQLAIWTFVYFWTLAISIAAGTLFFVYRLCGKPSSSILLLAVAVAEGGLTWSYWPQLDAAEAALPHFLAPGLVEEAFKVVPLLVVIGVARLIAPPARSRVDLTEPLDDILLATASALGFGVAETMILYVRHGLSDFWALDLTDGHAANYFQDALDLLSGYVTGYLGSIPRTLDLLVGHVAFASCFGYAIGLARLRASNARNTIGILLTGFATAALLHNLWDGVPDRPEFHILVAVASYAFMASGILKARLISPNRAMLRPSSVLGPIVAHQLRRPCAGLPRADPHPWKCGSRSARKPSCSVPVLSW